MANVDDSYAFFPNYFESIFDMDDEGQKRSDKKILHMTFIMCYQDISKLCLTVVVVFFLA